MLDTDCHILLAAGTASGKTEAAFLPILTQLYHDRPQGVGALYIGPLKALINDQFARLTELCQDGGIPVTAWHGDVGQSHKQRLLRNPAGILQITPESLEGLLLNRVPDLQRVFADLRWVVIDEIHAFMDGDRGGQVLALLDRLARFASGRDRLPRRAGLSATLGNYAEAERWLAGASGRRVHLIEHTKARSVYLFVEHFWERPESDDEDGAEREPRETKAAGPSANAPALSMGDDTAAAERIIARAPDLYEAAYGSTLTKKSIIFTNSRGDAEAMITGLRRLAELRASPDIYHVHHGSIATELREAAELAMREAPGPQCTAATVTLELGIDLGGLDRVLQRGPTWSVSSFLQRLGRTGRRGQRPEMFFLIAEEADENAANVLERLPWELLRAIAIIQLYAEERWLEPVKRAQVPGSLLYQQTMSVLASAGELTLPELAERVLTLSPFQHVTQDQLRTLLRHLVAIDHLQRTETGTVILGLAGERVVRSYRFLATFQDAIEWTVKEGQRAVGTLSGPVPVGERFALAGRIWRVTELVPASRLIIAARIKGALRTRFEGGGGEIHDRVVERMRRVLIEDTVYGYLGDRAQARLADARALARATGVAEGPALLTLGGNTYAMLPWAGTEVLRTLRLALGATPGIRSTVLEGFAVRCALDPTEEATALTLFQQRTERIWSGAELVHGLERHQLLRAKYDEFLPDSLLRDAFVADAIVPERGRALLADAMMGGPKIGTRPTETPS